MLPWHRNFLERPEPDIRLCGNPPPQPDIQPVFSAMQRIATAVLTSLLVGCGATGTQFKAVSPPSEERSVFYIYRPSRVAAGALSPLLSLDGQPAGRVPNGSFARREVTAGSHKVQLLRPSSAWGNFKEPSIELTTRPGDVSFVRYDIVAGKESVTSATVVSGLFIYVPFPVMEHKLVSVEASEALLEIGETRESE